MEWLESYATLRSHEIKLLAYFVEDVDINLILKIKNNLLEISDTMKN